MTDRPSTELPEPYRLTAVVLGGVIGIVGVVAMVLGLGVVEVALVLLPIVAAAAVGLVFAARTRRRGDL